MRTTLPDSTWAENTYNLLDQIIRVTDSSGFARTNHYLVQGLVFLTTTAAGAIQRTLYDVDDLATNTFDANGVEMTLEYDALDR